ncbi:MAG TPA: nucleotide exchange factor GrpE [Pyrinomonadaceae bacterium]|jgi:molecular chaperone GrpE (heat shock protein)
MDSGEPNDEQVAAVSVESAAEEIREMNGVEQETPFALEVANDSAEVADASSVPDDNGSTAASTPVETDGALLQSLAEQVETLARSVAEANHLSQERERIIDRLHQENQHLRQGELQQAILPIFRDLIRLYDDLRQTSRSYGSRTEIAPPQPVRDFECFAEMVTDILFRQGVERYEAREGEQFNPKEHRVLEAVSTEEEAKDRTLARSIRDGFRNEARIIRLVEAEVYRYRPPTASPEEASNEQAENVQ